MQIVALMFYCVKFQLIDRGIEKIFLRHGKRAHPERRAGGRWGRWEVWGVWPWGRGKDEQSGMAGVWSWGCVGLSELSVANGMHRELSRWPPSSA